MNKILPLAAAIAAASSAWAQATTLDTVVVTATRFTQAENNTPAMLSVIDRQQIENSGAQTVADALKASGAVQIRDLFGDGNRAAVSMRGFGQNSATNVLLLIDGRRLNNPTLQSPNLNGISIADVEQIEIIQGSAGVLYGEQAVAGVINIITRQAQRSQGRIELTAGSYDQQRLHASYSHLSEHGIGLRLSGDQRDSDGYRDNNEVDFDSLSAELSYEYDTGRLFFAHQQVRDALELPGALADAQLAANRRQSQNTGDFFNDEIQVQRLGIEQALNSNVDLLMEASLRDSDGKGASFGFDFTQDTRVKTLSPRLVAILPSAGGEAQLSAGYDWIRSDYQAFGSSNSEQAIDALYAQARLPLSRQLQLTVGARNSQVEDTNLSTSSRNRQDALVTELGLSYQLDQTHRLFLRRDENFRYANIDENGLTLPGVDFLKPQKGISWEAGWAWSGAQSRLTASLYRLALENEIFYDPEIANPNSWSGKGANVNLDDSRRQGLIIDARHSPSEQLTLAAYYTYTDARFTAGSFDGKDVPYVAAHSLSLSADYRLNSAWSLHLDGQYSGSRYQDDDYNNQQAKVDADLVLNSTLRWRQGPWDARLRINNLTDRDYDGYTLFSASSGSNHYPAPGRNVLLGLAYNF